MRSSLTTTLLATASIPVLRAPRTGAELVTELIAGETVEPVEERDGWLEVVIPAHATRLDPRGYPGWVRPRGLTEAGDWSPDLLVSRHNPAGLPLGTPLESRGGGVYAASGKGVEIDGDCLCTAGEPCERGVIEISHELLGLPYRWGGTDSTTGMDCSGMVYRVMLLQGIEVPRDADDQFDRAPFASEEHWERARPGDLVFFGERSVTHVGFYLGDGRYISEHGVGQTVVRSVEEDHYRGYARYG